MRRNGQSNFSLVLEAEGAHGVSRKVLANAMMAGHLYLAWQSDVEIPHGEMLLLVLLCLFNETGR